MKFLQLKKSLDTPRSIYSITGDDEFLVSQSLRILKEGLVTCFDEFNYLKVDMDNTSIKDYPNLLNTMAFGDSYRLVVFTAPNALSQTHVWGQPRSRHEGGNRERPCYPRYGEGVGVFP